MGAVVAGLTSGDCILFEYGQDPATVEAAVDVGFSLLPAALRSVWCGQ
jgi:hypothetical protein